MHAAAKVLVVDDDAADRDALVATLQGRGYRSAAAGAAEADEVARSFRPDVVVLEMVGARGMVGEWLAQRLRASGDPLLVFVSREQALAARLLAFDVGADDYLTKPYAIEELMARLQAVLRRSGRHGYAVSQVGRLVVDERAHRVEFDGRAIDLGPTDFLLLAVLARHAGLVLTKARLLELVWGYEPYDENLVVVRISLLRRSLGAEAAELIRTVRGVGYVLRDDGAEET
ncbi:MAG TPA: response regulator transcription factor [Acidimicrobiales bacterium]|nr:response regulator transcription factor [Acidimicrobiales bacterium]